MIKIEFDIFVFREDNTYVAYCPGLDVSSCGNSVEHAKKMLKTAIRLFLEEAEKMNNLKIYLKKQITRKMQVVKWLPPKLVATESVGL